ncbi:MAG: chlorite dismutase family protein [Candidatus Micrarchaeaceae archaeon]
MISFLLLKARSEFYSLPLSMREYLLGETIDLCKDSNVKAFYSKYIEPTVDLILMKKGKDIEEISEFYSNSLRKIYPYINTVENYFGYEKSKDDVETNEKYLILYPFTKTHEWYQKSEEERKKMMEEHIRIGSNYKGVKQLLLESFGISESDFVLAYFANELEEFSKVVKELRYTKARIYTKSDTPIYVGIKKEIGPAFMGML